MTMNHSSTSSAAKHNAHFLPTLLMGLGGILALLLLGLAIPKWLIFLITIAAANGLVSLGIVILMRSGVVSFGQGMVFALGGYAAALAYGKLGITDALVLSIGGGCVAALLSFPFAYLIARYRGIFFAMLSLSLSMVLYGILIKSESMGGSDGFNMGRPTLFGIRAADEWSSYLNYAVTITLSGLSALATRIYFNSTRGLVSLAARDNEIRVEYLGSSVQELIAANYLLAAFMGGMGGALAVIALGHIEPNFSYWTTSGEFVFVSILAGHYSVIAVFIASTVLEIVRSFSSLYFPNTWQLVLGLFLLAVIRFLPRGIGSLWEKRAKKNHEGERA